MTKIAGYVGFHVQTETEPGIYTQDYKEQLYYCDLIDARLFQSNTEKVNDSVRLGNKVSLVADSYMRDNFASAVYFRFSDTKWRITDIGLRYPRVDLSLGEVYNA